MKQLTKISLSLILVLVLAASLASIASAVDRELDRNIIVSGLIGEKSVMTTDPPTNPTPTPTASPTPEPGATPTPTPSATPTPTPKPTPTPTPGTGGNGGGGGSTSSPKTGDETNIMLYAMTALLSMVMLILLWRKKGDQYEENKVLLGS